MEPYNKETMDHGKHLSDGNPEHVQQTGKKMGEKIRFVTALDMISNTLNISNSRDLFLRAQLFLSYH